MSKTPNKDSIGWVDHTPTPDATPLPPEPTKITMPVGTPFEKMDLWGHKGAAHQDLKSGAINDPWVAKYDPVAHAYVIASKPKGA